MDNGAADFETLAVLANHAAFFDAGFIYHVALIYRRNLMIFHWRCNGDALLRARQRPVPMPCMSAGRGQLFNGPGRNDDQAGYGR
jgi:hypothetical protein